MNPDNRAKGIKGRRIDGEPESEAMHFYLCPVCGQAVDMRELEQVYHHETNPEHKPIPTS